MPKTKLVLSALGGAILGVAYGTLVVPVFDTLLSKVQLFPAYAGESDFAFRFSWYLLGVLPLFALIGAWIGFQAAKRIASLPYALLGGVVGTVVFAGALEFADRTAEPLSAQLANTGYVVSMLAHLTLVVVGVATGLRLLERKTTQ